MLSADGGITSNPDGRPTLSTGDGTSVCSSKQWQRKYSPAEPDPWVQRKFVVFVVFGLSAWALYVAVGRVCVPAIHQTHSAAFKRKDGIGILVGYLILWFMFMWSYVAIVTTSPGFAKTLVSCVNQPPSCGAVAQVEMTTARSPEPWHTVSQPSDSTTHPTSPSQAEPARDPGLAWHSPTGRQSSIPRPLPPVNLGPRWCYYCRIIKPDRTHHCRHCGTCVLLFDHHCVWIGQCVGWRNHSIFVTFNLWAGLFCLYNTVILSVDTALAPKIDGQKLALIAISGFLFIFTLILLYPNHIWLVLSATSTLESFERSAQRRREADLLQRELGLWNCAGVRRVRRQWEEEWGGVQVNDRWAWGSKRSMWQQGMGTSWLGWVFPVGRPLGDGIHFPTNPRFGPNGEWLPKRDWPEVIAT